MKKITFILTVMATLCFTASVALAGSIRVQSDEDYTVKLECSGTDKTIEIRDGTTTVTFHSTNDSCDIVGGDVQWPVKKLKDDGKWKIRDGKAEKN